MEIRVERFTDFCVEIKETKRREREVYLSIVPKRRLVTIITTIYPVISYGEGKVYEDLIPSLC